MIYDPNADCPLYLAVTPARANDVTSPKRACEIAALYKRRWAIKLFFR